MSLLLAIEPDSSQADRLRQLIREKKVDAELLVVTSAYAAIVTMNRQAPDVLLFGLTVAPRHQNTVVKHLRSLTDGDVPQVLTIPLLTPVDSAPQKTSRFGFGRSRAPVVESPEPSRFADQVGAALVAANRARRPPATVLKAPALVEPPPIQDVPSLDQGVALPEITTPPTADVVVAERDAGADETHLAIETQVDAVENPQPRLEMPTRDVEDLRSGSRSWPRLTGIQGNCSSRGPTIYGNYSRCAAMYASPTLMSRLRVPRMAPLPGRSKEELRRQVSRLAPTRRRSGLPIWRLILSSTSSGWLRWPSRTGDAGRNRGARIGSRGR